jgi:hypothetical protein
MARPTKFTEERRQRFLAALSAGAFRETAARHAGWSPATMYRLLRNSSPAAAAFRADMQRVETELELRLAGTVTQASFRDPRLALAMLERRFGERWRRQAVGSAPLEELSATPVSGPEAPVVLDAAAVELLLPRLLESRAGTSSVAQISRFASRSPRDADADG